MISLSAYLPQDRCHALACGISLPPHADGAVLFADISGFTPLTEMLRQALGPRRGSEALTDQINATYAALITQVNTYRGSVIGFAGDAITCWFSAADGSVAHRATACAVGMQRAMSVFTHIPLPGGGTTALALKVAVACGPARRFVVGDPEIQSLDLLAGDTLARVAAAEHHALASEILLDEATVSALGSAAKIIEWRDDHDRGERFALLGSLAAAPPVSPWPALSPAALSAAMLRPWLLPAVYQRELAGQGTFLTELRPAVALFLRFTGIDYDADPDAHTRLDAFIRAVQGVLTRYDGALLQVVIGDKGSYLCIAFGAPVAHEDDARRAVLAALSLQREAVVAGGLPPLQIGISQGIMRCGAYGSVNRHTYGILGDEVNVAARLMSMAAPGGTLVSAEIHAAVASAVAFEPRPPVRIKGKAELQLTFAVGDIYQRRATRLQEPTYDLPLVGRTDEIVLASQVLHQALAGHGQVLGITAEAGQGKSRLVAEIIRLAYQRHVIGYGGACHATGTRSPYLVWQPIWRAIFNSDPDASLRQQIHALQELVAIWAPERADATPLLGPLLGLSLPESDFTQSLEPKDRQGALHALLRDCLMAAAREAQGAGGGLLIVLEDTHWIDAASDDLLNDLVRVVQELPVLIVLAYRPRDITQLHGLRLERLPGLTQITLGGLDTAAAEQLIRAKLLQIFPAQAGVIPDTLVSRLMERTQGNPFFLEELLNYLHDREIDPYKDGALESLALPDSLHRLILSRLDQMTGQQQVILKASSVIGRRFPVDWLRGAFPTLSSPEGLTRELAELARLDMTPLDTPEPELAYLFKHVIIREVAYESLGAATRTALHGQLANYLERSAGADTDGVLDILAYHYEQSDNLAKKREYLRRAGAAAADRYANAAALAYLSRALDLVPRDNLSERYDLLLARETIYEVLGERALESADLDQLRDLAERLGDPRRCAEVALQCGRYAERIGDYPASVAATQEAIAWAQAANLIGLEATGYQRWGWTLLRQRDYADARVQLERSLQLARANNDQHCVCRALTDLGTLALEQGAHTEARGWYTQSLSLARSLGDRRQECHALGNLGTLLAEQGDFSGARVALEQNLAYADAIGDNQIAGTTRSNLSFLCILMGDYPGAQRILERGLPQLREVGDRRVEAATLGNLGLVATHKGEYAAAYKAYSDCLALAQEIGDPVLTGGAQRGLGNVAFGTGDMAAAEDAYQQSLATLREVGTPALIAEPLAGLALLALARGDVAAALTPAEEILSSLATGSLDGAEEPMVVYLACYQALRANADPRAPLLLARARADLLARAEQISDPVARQNFLEQVPAHRGLLADG